MSQRSPQHDAASGSGSGVARVRVAALLRDAIAAASTPARADRILLRAVDAEHLAAVPREPRALQAFALGPLLRSVDEELGESAQRVVAERLAPLVAALAGLEQGSPEEAAPGADQGAIAIGGEPVQRAIGIGVHADDRLVLESALGDGVVFAWIGAFDPLEPALRAAGDDARTLIVECRRANPLVPRLLALDPMLLDDAVLILWGASRIEQVQVRRRFPGAVVIACARETGAREVGTLALIGAR